MSNVIIPIILADSRPTSFSYSFVTRHGVGVDVTVNTGELGIAHGVVNELTETLQWKPVARGYASIWWTPLAVIVVGILAAMVISILLMVLQMAGWLPSHIGSTQFADGLDSMFYIMKLVVRMLLVGVPITALLALAIDLMRRSK